jgi:membrane protease YdiL (CAAX protease family)
MKVFKEEQRFTQTWLIILLVICTIIPITTIIQKYLKVNETISIKEFIATIVVIIVSISVLFFFKLTTKIDEKGIHYQFFPFHFSMKLIPWNEISKVGTRTYFPISEFGGWGLKGGFFFNKGKGKAINVSGDIGIQLILKNGDKLLIGTQKKEAAKKVLETYKNKIQ